MAINLSKLNEVGNRKELFLEFRYEPFDESVYLEAAPDNMNEVQEKGFLHKIWATLKKIFKWFTSNISKFIAWVGRIFKRKVKSAKELAELVGLKPITLPSKLQEGLNKINISFDGKDETIIFTDLGLLFYSEIILFFSEGSFIDTIIEILQDMSKGKNITKAQVDPIIKRYDEREKLFKNRV